MSDEEYAYLRDGFNPRNLRKDQLRNVLLSHDVEYSNDMLKPQLIDLFQTQIAPRRAELRAQFVDVAGSAENIENATPPQARNAAKEAPQALNASPRAQRARSRSPARARSPARGRRAKTEPAADEEPVPNLANAPNLAPPSSAPEPPLSPRRRRANRKVEVPGTEPDTVDVVPTEEIKIKAPRSPRKRHAESDDPGDDSFSTNNVFQSRPAGKRRKENTDAPRKEPKKEPKKEPSEASAPQTAPGPSAVPAPEPFVVTEAARELPSVVDTAPVTEADIGIDILPLDADFVADLNAEVDRLQSDQLFNFDQSEPQQALESLDEPISPPAINSRDTTPSLPASSRSETPVVQSPAAQTPAQRRRGFIPSLAELSVSRAFAEQLEPYLVATPSPTPRHATPAQQQSSRHASPSPINSAANSAANSRLQRVKRTETRSESPAELPDTETAAAEEIHEAIEHAMDHAADAVHNYDGFRLPRPRLPAFRPRFPRFRLPRVRFPRVRFPRPRLPRLPKLRIPRVRVPRPRLPRVRLPTVRLPRVRLPHIHIPRPPLPSWSGIGYVTFLVASITVNAALLGLGGLLAAWYRDAWANAEFCGVGAVAPHVYPEWTFYDTGYDALAQVQANFRDMMDEVWPECVSCPANAKCYQGRIVMCNNGFRQVDHPLSLDGLLPYPPRCKPDWEAQRKVEVLSERAAYHLRNKRAEVLCGGSEYRESDVEAASAVDTDELRTILLGEKSPLLDEEEFEVLLQQAFDDLPSRYADLYVVSFDPALEPEAFASVAAQHEESPNSIDGQMLTNVQKHAAHHGSGEREPGAAPPHEDAPAKVWLVSTSDALLPVKCRARRWVLAHKLNLIYATSAVVVASLAAIVVVRKVKARRMQQQYVQTFVARLKQQRRAADRDLSSKTVPYLRATDLRREVPRAQWKRVQDSLEAVDGVRMRQIEVYGEITRIWEWTR